MAHAVLGGAPHQQPRLDCDQAPLDEVFSFLADLHGTPLRFDRDACRRAGIALGQPATLDLRAGCTFRAAVQILAADYGLAVTAHDDALLVAPLAQVAR